MQISGCLQLSSRILMERGAAPALHSFATWWQCNLHLPAQEVSCLWFPPSLLLIHSNYHICRWQLQTSEFLLSISSINLIEACWVYFSNKLCNISKDINSLIEEFFFQLMQYCMFFWSLMKFWGPLWNCSLLPTSLLMPFSINPLLSREEFSSDCVAFVASLELRTVSNYLKRA